MFRNNLRKKGFTLVELIVVLIIIGILLAIVIPNLTGYIDKAQLKTVEADCRIIETAARAAYLDVYSKYGHKESFLYSTTIVLSDNSNDLFKQSFYKHLDIDSLHGTVTGAAVYPYYEPDIGVAINYKTQNGKKYTYRSEPTGITLGETQ